MSQPSRLTDTDKKRLVDLIQNGKPLPSIYKNKLFAPDDGTFIQATKEYRLVYEGIAVPSKALQLGLNFAANLPELFGGIEMGEDALRVLNEYITIHTAISADVAAELPHVRQAARWAARLG